MAEKIFDITPSANCIDVISAGGYTFSSAIADIVDNSISANAENITIYIDFESKPSILYILDDGDGMTKQELYDAAVIAKLNVNAKRKANDNGRYSSGLKSASRFLGEKLYVSSKTKSDETTIKIDWPQIIKTNEWKASDIDNFPRSNLIGKHGTLVFLEGINLNKTSLTKDEIYAKIEELQKDLSHIYCKIIESGRQKIYIKTPTSDPIKVAPWNPFKLLESKSTKLIYSQSITYKGKNIPVKIYIMPVYDKLSHVDQNYMKGNGLLDQQGFYIYRNDRLIQEGGWLDLPGIELDAKSNYARIDVSIPTSLDKEFKIGLTKRSIVIPDELIGTFTKIANVARKASRKSINIKNHPEFKQRLSKEIEPVWNVSTVDNALFLSINENHPLIKKVFAKLHKNDQHTLLTILSKSLPVNLIQTQNTSTKTYSRKELFELMEEAYSSLLLKYKTKQEVNKKMANMEPFKTHMDELFEFIELKEAKNEK